MYNIKLDLVEDLKGGRTSRYIAKILGVTENYISTIFNGKFKCTKLIAVGIISIRYNISINHDNMENLLEKHFIYTITN